MLVDGVVVANKVLYLAKCSRKIYLIFKVYFKKTYDLVSWSFLDFIIIKFNFNNMWMFWIRACVFDGNVDVLVNSYQTPEIQIKIGLK